CDAAEPVNLAAPFVDLATKCHTLAKQCLGSAIVALQKCRPSGAVQGPRTVADCNVLGHRFEQPGIPLARFSEMAGLITPEGTKRNRESQSFTRFRRHAPSKSRAHVVVFAGDFIDQVAPRSITQRVKGFFD